MRKLLFVAIFMLTAPILYAQDDMPYADKAAQLQKEIWGTKTPEFQLTAVPAAYSKESAVVLARSFNLQRTSNGRIKFMIIAAASTTHTVKLTTWHERVKLNDKAALDAFSTIEYQKKLDKTVNLLITKIANVNNTYIGAKIIKPTGKEIIVNTDEEVLLKNETKDQKGKLAIPGLEVGDILDYYISTTEVIENAQEDSYSDNDNLFVLADEYPVLYFSLDFQFNKKTQVQYIYANGAPHFDENTNDAGDKLFSLKLHNLPKYQSQLWTSPLRQFPYIEIGSSYQSKFNNFLAQEHDNSDMSRLDANKDNFEKSFGEFPGFDELEKKMKDYYNSNKAYKAAPLDSTMKILYDEWKFYVFCNYQGTEIDNMDDINYRTARSTFAAKMVSMILTDLKIDHDVFLVASRYSNSLENVFAPGDYSAMLCIYGDKPMYMSFDDVVTHFNEVPARFQGEKAIALRPKRRNSTKYEFTEDSATLPVAPSDANIIDEQLQVSLLPANAQKLKISRVVSEKGALRHVDQLRLLPAGLIDDTYQAMVKGDNLEKRLSKDPKTKKMYDAYQYAFNDQAANISKKFTEEIKDEFDQAPEKVEDCKIIDPALENTSPVFRYSASFVLNNMVKKAGDNYIIDVGKLTGSFYKLEDKDRKRSVDIYMPCARSYKYAISFTIPPGYTVKGAEELNAKKLNKTGSFSSQAVVTGNTLNITISRAYNNNFETIGAWPAVVELIDAASNFNTQKILLEKK